jgi:uncharacterized RDD family membrane protein YckC/Flp pilus assembly protein TadD
LDIAIVAVLNVLIQKLLGWNPFVIGAGTSPSMVALRAFEPLLFHFVGLSLLFMAGRGQTPGMKLFHIRLVTDKGGVPGMGSILLRTFGMQISALFGYLGYFWMAFDRDRQTWHDKMAHTYVVDADAVVPSRWAYVASAVAYLAIWVSFMWLSLNGTGAFTTVGSYRNMYDTVREIAAIEHLRSDVRAHWDKANAFITPYWNADITDPDVAKEVRPQARAAIEELKLARDLDPTNAVIHMRMGDVFARLDGDPAAAKELDSYTTAVNLDPDNGDYVTKMGNAYNRLGQYDQAIVAFRRALSLYDDYRYAYEGLGAAYEGLKNYPEARKNYELAIVDFLRYNSRGSYNKEIAKVKRAIEALPATAQ